MAENLRKDDSYEVFHVSSHIAGLEQLYLHPDTHFDVVVVDFSQDHRVEGKKMLRACVNKKLLPFRVAMMHDHNDERQRRQVRGECVRCGADVVLSSTDEIVDAHQVFLKQDDHDDQMISRRWKRQRTLQELAHGALTHRVQQLHSHSHRLEAQIKAIQQQQHADNDVVRVVHISDTHNLHRRVPLPEGDVLLHTGDICGNYRAPYEIDVVEQFRDFLDWIEQEAIPRYKKIVWMAGNHDTYLDPTLATSHRHYERARTLYQEFLRRIDNKNDNKVCYLCRSETTFRGLRIYGTPTTMCRVESANRRMRSNAFERTKSERLEEWKEIPSDVDILLTHMPPAGLGQVSSRLACSMLTHHVYHEHPQQTPLLHAFGHIHSQYGVLQYGSTILSNASQERLLRTDPYGGGTPIVLDIPITRRNHRAQQQQQQQQRQEEEKVESQINQ